MDLYFKFKQKSIPKDVTKFINKGLISGPLSFTNIYKIDQKQFRRLKLENIQNTISRDEKKLIEYLINTDFVYFLTKEEVEKLKGTYYVGVSGTSGTMGTSGPSGFSGTSGTMCGVSGFSGTSGYVGTSFSYNSSISSTSINQPSVNIYTPPNIPEKKKVFNIKIPFLSKLKKSVK